MIFAGPSLPPSVRPADTRLDWRPPARQGDLYRAAMAKPAAIGLIDGYFDAVPSVWHKEILWAMTQGIIVYGAASIGALRAAELSTFGMIGVGRVFQMFYNGLLTDDDEVALQHGPAEVGYLAVTEAMINIRDTFALAAQTGIISSESANRLIALAKAKFYQQRDYASLLAAEESRALVDPDQLSEWLLAHSVDTKQADATALVEQMRNDLAHAPVKDVRFRFSATAAWHQMVNSSGL